MNRRVKILIRVLVFWAIFAIVFIPVSRVLTDKYSWRKYTPFYEQENDYDVLFAGISHSEVGYSPMELWEDYGIASFNLGMLGCRIPLSYWAIKNALQYTTPKLLVMDVRRIEAQEEPIDKARSAFTTDSMPLTRTKVEMVQDLFTHGESFEEKLEVLFPFIRYHSRWSSLDEEDFDFDDYWPDNGSYHASTGMYLAGSGSVEKTDKKRQGDEYSIGYLRKIIELCKENNIDVLLLEHPFYASTKQIEYANGVEDIAKEYGLYYMNFFAPELEDTIDYSTDMRDKTHLNDSGAFKVTKAVGEFIKEHYDIPDRRLDASYESWNDDYSYYQERMFQRIIAGKENGLYYYLMTLSLDDINVEIAIPENSNVYSDQDALNMIRNLSGDGAQIGKLEKAAKKNTSYYVFIDRDSESITEKTGKNFDINDSWEDTPDILVTIYDKATKEQIDRAAFKLKKKGSYISLEPEKQTIVSETEE